MKSSRSSRKLGESGGGGGVKGGSFLLTPHRQLSREKEQGYEWEDMGPPVMKYAEDILK